MATTERVTGGINNLDLVYAQTLINNLRNRINTTGVVAAQDVQDLIWLYNSFVNHTHSYYDYEFSKYGNVNQSVFVDLPDETRFSMNDPVSYVRLNTGSIFKRNRWYWGGSYLGLTAVNETWLSGFSRGPLQQTITSTEYDSDGYAYTVTNYFYSIIRAGYYVTYSSSVGSTKSTYGINGGALFQYTAELASGKITAAGMLNALANMVNNIRSHTHLFDDVSV